VISAGRAPAAAKRVITSWVFAFNAPDLDGMLALMHDRVDFHPLSLSGDCRTYHGHDEVREWFAALATCQRQLRIEQLQISSHVSGEIVASGVLTRLNCVEPSPFCALHTIENRLIVAAFHYLSDPESLLAPDPADQRSAG
jgi:ketosteroid isomerase-like protein